VPNNIHCASNKLGKEISCTSHTTDIRRSRELVAVQNDKETCMRVPSTVRCTPKKAGTKPGNTFCMRRCEMASHRLSFHASFCTLERMAAGKSEHRRGRGGCCIPDTLYATHRPAVRNRTTQLSYTWRMAHAPAESTAESLSAQERATRVTRERRAQRNRCPLAIPSRAGSSALRFERPRAPLRRCSEGRSGAKSER
jgi:hypothetical protein